MSREDCLTLRDIKTVFTAVIEGAGGRVSDAHDDGARLFMRSILPWDCEVHPGDRLHAGTALRATDREVWVHPYVFREACTNGAIVAEAIHTRYLARLDDRPREAALAAVHEAVCTCSEGEAFADAAKKMRSACAQDATDAVNILMAIARFEDLGDDWRSLILDRFFSGADSSQFGLINAVTSLARDTRDPKRRWRLEELGGALCAAWDQTPRRVDSAAKSLVAS